MSVQQEVKAYYQSTFDQFGASPKGADWNDVSSQYLRFAKITELCEGGEGPFSLLDYGCGYGAYRSFLNEIPNLLLETNCNFTGLDLVPSMLEEATSAFPKDQWISEVPAGETFDFVTSSGIFNVKLERSNEEWLKYILETLHTFDALSTKGFAFNVLTSYSDLDKRADKLFYADPCFLFDYCKKHFSRFVSLSHDYPLYEFTILVRKA